MCYSVFGMGHIKDSLLLLRKSSPCSARVGPLPYNRIKNILSVTSNKTFLHYKINAFLSSVDVCKWLHHTWNSDSC